MVAINKQDITAVILAGGEARRMKGQDKGLIQIDSQPMIVHILQRLGTQVEHIIINANRNIESYAQYGHPVVSDQLSGFCGPLAGIASAMQDCQTSFLLTVPCDSPFIPAALVQRLAESIADEDIEIAVANNGERMQPVFSLMKSNLLDSLQAYLNAGERKIDRWFKQHHFVEVDFSDKPNAFMNVNTPEELEEAKSLLTTNKSSP